MPRIQGGYGDFDWEMPGETATQDLTGNRSYFLRFRFIPSRPVNFTLRHGEPSQGLVYRKGGYEPQDSYDSETGIKWTNEESATMIPEDVQRISRGISLVPPLDRVEVVWRQTSPVFFYLKVATVEGVGLRYPTRFIQTLTRKIANYMAI